MPVNLLYERLEVGRQNLSACRGLSERRIRFTGTKQNAIQDAVAQTGVRIVRGPC